MRDGFVKVGAATPDILVADCVHNREEIVKKVKEALDAPHMKVITTGGYAKIIQDGTDVIDYYDGLLTLKGLNIIYHKNR